MRLSQSLAFMVPAPDLQEALEKSTPAPEAPEAPPARDPLQEHYGQPLPKVVTVTTYTTTSWQDAPR